jgi:hypothetical protein
MTAPRKPHSASDRRRNAPVMVSNESGTDNAVVCATLVGPAGSPFRIETDPTLSA